MGERLRRLAHVGIGAVAMAVMWVTLNNVLPSGGAVDQLPAHVSSVDTPQFQRDAATLLGTSVTHGNSVQDLQNGDAYFPLMLQDIRSARSTIDLETYIFRSGKVSHAFVTALAERAAAGVHVHVLADWIGSRANTDDADRLRAAGVEFKFYHRLSLRGLGDVNARTHRKLLIVDGHVAYTGGMGIDDAWLGNADKPWQKRDMMFRVQGPAVRQMQAVFEDHWVPASGKALLGEGYSPALQSPRDVAVQTFASPQGGGGENTRLMFLLAIAGARRSIDLEASYFVPDRLTTEALLAALHRGVKVRIIVEGEHVDSHVVIDASRTYWGPFLEAGAQIYRFGPSLFHSKLMVVDQYLTIGGSGNFDNRSFRYNAECNINIYDRQLGERMTTVFNQDIAVSDRVTLTQWRNRPWSQRIVDGFWATVASQL